MRMGRRTPWRVPGTHWPGPPTFLSGANISLRFKKLFSQVCVYVCRCELGRRRNAVRVRVEVRRSIWSRADGSFGTTARPGLLLPAPQLRPVLPTTRTSRSTMGDGRRCPDLEQWVFYDSGNASDFETIFTIKTGVWGRTVIRWQPRSCFIAPLPSYKPRQPFSSDFLIPLLWEFEK